MTGRKYCIYRFSGVEVRERELQILRAGRAFAVEPKAFRTLLCLLRQPNQLLSKDELQTAVWGETAVSDNSLTRAISLLRKLLDDDPHGPRYIETVSTVGYRFICPVEVSNDPIAGNDSTAASGTPSKEPPDNGEKGRAGFWIWTALGTIGIGVAGAFALMYWMRPLPPPRITDYVQLTRDGRLKGVAGTDGVNLYLNLFNATQYTPSLVPVTGGQVTTLSIDLPNRDTDPSLTMVLSPGGISPDGTRMLVVSSSSNFSKGDLWIVGTSGHPARYLASSTMYAAWSPDGKQIVFSARDGSLYTIPSEGGIPHLLLASPEPGTNNARAYDFSWSPDGRRIRFIRAPDMRIWEVSPNGSNPHRVLAGWDDSHTACCGQWTPDGDFYLFSAASRLPGLSHLQLWAIDERHGLGQPIQQPIQLTSGPMILQEAIPSRDGTKVFTVGRTFRGELVLFDKQSNQFQPFLGGISAEFVLFSPDGKHLAYVSYPEGILWFCNRDGTGLVQLTSPPMVPQTLQWSPDGQWIAFEDWGTSSSNKVFVYLVSTQGGAPRRLIPDDTEAEHSPTWSPDGKQIVYSTGIQAQEADDRTSLKTRILDLATHQVTTLPPPPKACWNPRLSPNGRWISFLGAPQTSDPVLFDMQSQRYSVLQGLPPFKTLGYNRWSHDSQSVYFLLKGPDSTSSVYRVFVSGGKAERVVDLKDFHHIGRENSWMGLDPTDTPLLLRDVGDQDVYAFTFKRK